MMDLRQLSYFLEVANHGNFSKASEAIHLSQPTISKMVKNLEEELGVVLFNRSTRKVELTDAGKVVQMHAKSVLHAAQHLLSAVADLTEMKSGQFRLGLPPVIGSSFFPRIISDFNRLYPDISIQLVEEGGKRVEQLLLQGEIDLGVVVLSADMESFEIVPIVEKRLHLVLPRSHRLSARPYVRLSDLKDDPFILFRQEFNLHDRVKDACIREGFEPKVAHESTQWDYMYELVRTGQGVALLPETVCAKFAADKTCAVRRTEPEIHWDLGIIWKRGGYVSHAAKGWIAFVQQVFGAD